MTSIQRTPAAAAPPQTTAPSGVAHVRILSVNDFHGQLPDSDAKADGVDVGGAATLAAYVQRERAGNPDGTVFVSAGDMLGASPPESTLLQHYSTVAALDAMGLDVATFGNHEFDKGYAEAMRIIFGDAGTWPADAPKAGAAAVPGSARKKRGGTAKADATRGAKHVADAAGKPAWPGSPFPWVSANVVNAKTKRPVLPPYVIKVVDGVKVAFVGADTAELKKVTMASGITQIESLDPAETINKLIPEIRAKGARTIVVVVHEGGEVDKAKGGQVGGAIVRLAEALDSEVDAIVSAHSHQEYATQINGKQVVQAGSYAKALGEIDLTVDRATGQVVGGSTKLIRNDEHGIARDPVVAGMVASFEKAVAPRANKVIGKIAAPVTRALAPTGESALGSYIADAQRAFAKTDIAFMNKGGIRQDLVAAGPVTWGALFGVQPFANHVMRMEMTGAEVRELLEQQFNEKGAKVLQVSGIVMHLDPTKPAGQRVTTVTLADGTPLDPAKTYSVAANSFIAEGGDGYAAFTKGRKKQDLGIDLDALVKYLAAGNEPPAKPTGRIVIDAGTLPSDSH